MTPAARFNALLASATISIMLFLVTFGAALLRQWSADHLVALQLSGLLLSAGIYRLLALLLRGLMDRSTWLSSLLLGPHFLHGTWAGYFIGHSGEKRYTIEHFVQSMDSLSIIGRSYDAAGRKHGFWESEATSVDAHKGKLLFTYRMEVVTRDTPLLGINASVFMRQSAQHPASKLAGFAHDLNDRTRISIESVKLSNALLDWDSALQQAMSRFQAIDTQPVTNTGNRPDVNSV